MLEVGLQNPEVNINKEKLKIKLRELRVKRLKRELGKLQLSTTGTKNELQRRLREQLRTHSLRALNTSLHIRLQYAF